MQSVKRHIWALVAVLACASGASAQESRGSITGRVVDSTGGALPGATVTAVNDDTNSTQTVPTSGSGTYTVLYLVPGPYTLTVEQSGFRTTRQKVIVRVADRVVVDFTLDPAANSEEIFVVAETPAARDGQRDQHGPGHGQQAHQRDPARRRHGLQPDAPGRRARPSSARTRCSARWTTTTCAA